LLGYSKQAYYKRNNENEQEQLEDQIILEMIRKERHNMPRIGGRKLLHKLQDKLHLSGIDIGRDAFFDFLRLHGLLVKTRKRYCVTTLSAHWQCKYDNLLPGLTIVRIDQVWVCDITYIETGEGFLYLYLITDAYSHKIIGYNLSNDLKAQSAVVALNMAISQAQNCQDIIHHSDRGIQYGCQEYTAILNDKKIRSSMTEPNSPTQNAIAERVNGILKTEWIYETKYATKEQANKDIGRIIRIYNNDRPHASVSMLTPAKAHITKEPLKKMWKNYYKKKPVNVGTLEASAVLNVNQSK
jgi:putative transposase